MRWIDAEGIVRANLIDATPIGANVRSTVATYADIHDELRRAFARTPEAKAAGYKAVPLATTPAPCAALRVMARARYRSTCSFCPMSKSSARHVTAHVMQTRLRISIARARTGVCLRCRSSWT
ncbi:MAG: hypothetical protein ACLU37_04235 [Collinsella sp.]